MVSVSRAPLWRALRIDRPITPAYTVAIILLVTIATWISYLTWNYYLFVDDFYNFIIAQQMGLTQEYIVRSVFGQFIPLYRLSQLVYIKSFGVHFWPFRLISILLTWTSILIVLNIAARHRTSPVIIIPAIVLLIFTPVYVNSYQWWSAALCVLPSGLAVLGAIHIMSKPFRLTYRDTLTATLLFLISLGFYAKGLFIIIILAGVRSFIRSRDLSAGLVASCLGAVLDVLPMIVLGFGYLLIVYFGQYSSGAPPADLLMDLHYIWAAWSQGLMCGIFGLDRAHVSSWVIANTIGIGIMLVSVIRNPRAGFVWLSFIAYFVCSFAVIGRNRAVLFGTESANLGHYYTDIVMYFVALIFIAYEKMESRMQTEMNAVNYSSSILLSFCLAIHLMKVSRDVPHVVPVPMAKIATFVDNVREAMVHTRKSVRIANTIVPDYIMNNAWMAPLNQYQYFLLLFHRHGMTVPAEQATMVFNDDGNLVKTDKAPKP